MTFTISNGATLMLAFSACLFTVVTAISIKEDMWNDEWNAGLGVIALVMLYGFLWAIPSLLVWAVWATWFR